MNQIFSGPVQVAIQGARVLRFIEFTGEQAKYEIIGFEDSPVTIIDYRSHGLLAIQSLLETGDLPGFAPKFNQAAMVTVVQDETGKVVIELTDTEEYPSCVLWIAIGLGDLIPVYDYVYENIVSLNEENTYGLIAIYQISISDSPASSSRNFPSIVSSSSWVTTWRG